MPNHPGASVITSINSMVGGVGLALLAAKVASLTTAAALAVGITAAVVLFGLHLLYQQQQAASWSRGHRPRHHRARACLPSRCW
jgi:hypothetical protein